MPTNLAEDLAFRKAQIRHLEKIEFLSLRTQFLADNGDADAVIWSTPAKSVKTNTSELFASKKMTPEMDSNQLAGPFGVHTWGP